MTLPYNIARCAGTRTDGGNLAPQCVQCARTIYNTPKHCHPYYQIWIKPHRDALASACAFYIAPQPATAPAP